MPSLSFSYFPSSHTVDSENTTSVCMLAHKLISLILMTALRGWYSKDYYPHFTDLEKLIRLRETELLTQGESTDMIGNYVSSISWISFSRVHLAIPRVFLKNILSQLVGSWFVVGSKKLYLTLSYMMELGSWTFSGLGSWWGICWIW